VRKSVAGNESDDIFAPTGNETRVTKIATQQQIEIRRVAVENPRFADKLPDSGGVIRCWGTELQPWFLRLL